LEGIGSRGKEKGKRDGYIGIKPDPSTLSALYPVPLSTEKPSMDPGKTLATLGFMDNFYYLWTDFIIPRRDLFDVYTAIYARSSIGGMSRQGISGVMKLQEKSRNTSKYSNYLVEGVYFPIGEPGDLGADE
jgi:hypothetical protein